jgi:pimeloyl-ACP methyl ester carboxylesterase
MTYLLLAALSTVPSIAATTQVALFTGFGSGSGLNTGMGRLNTHLAAAGIPDYVGQVFEWTQHDAALDWVNLHAASRGTLVLIGHSFGGNSALQLADDFLSPLDVTVDLTVQIDPVKNFIAGANDMLPGNVEVGFNYYQISTGFFEPQGEDFVSGATNINVEVLFNDANITHTSIDDDSRLFARITANILANLNPYSADFDEDGDVDGQDFLVWQRGESPRSLSADDLTLWQIQYGNAGLNAPSVAVPEPRRAMVLIAAIRCVSVIRRDLR